jgi:cobalt-zinc-cadmium efflux system outer membrane protein
MLRHWFLCLSILLIGVSTASADEKLTLQDVIARARTSAPTPRVARARTEEARSALVGARRLATRNPAVEAEVGPRWSDGRSTDAQVSLSVPLDLGGRRDKRVAVAEADIRRQQLDADNTERLTVTTAIIAFYQVLYTDRRLALAEERVRLADAAQEVAAQRNKAGDVAEFEVNLARGEAARARSSVAAATSDQLRARGQLAAALGLPTLKGLSVAGDLADRSFLEQDPHTVARPDVRALEQEITLANAESTLAATERWPRLDLRVVYAHERDADIVLGGFSLDLPMFEHGQGEAARARARAARAQLELASRKAVIGSELDIATDAYAASVVAVQQLETEAIPISATNETSAAASYRAGKLDVGTLLLIRREVLDTRREHLDRLFDAAVAAVELWTARGGGTPR